MLSDSEKKILLRIARQSLEKYFSGEALQHIGRTDLLKENRAAFVTLKKHGQLRGCIGYIMPTKPLDITVAELAIEAATRDPRFSPIEAKELADIAIEISVMTPLERVYDINTIVVGKHGLYVKRGFRSGLLLPQVATEWGWDRKKFLEQTCYKAGIDYTAWKTKDIEIYSFSAEVFGEEQ